MAPVNVGEVINTAAFNGDFYVTTATVIPVVFLGVALQGGLWAWIIEMLSAGADTAKAMRRLIYLLPKLALFILLAGTAGEVLALYALLQRRSDELIDYIVFFSTVFLVILLGLSLGARIPGIVGASVNPLTLETEPSENLLWSGPSLQRIGGRHRPWRLGKIFLTDRRLVWMTRKELDPLVAAPVEIDIDTLRAISRKKESALSQLIRWPLSNAYLPQGSYRIDLTVDDGETYRFYVSSRGEQAMRHLQVESDAGQD